MTPTRTILRPPNILKKGINLAKTIPSLAASGFAKAEQPVQLSREKTCITCEYWNQMGNMGLGACSHTECGCTKYKRTFKVAKCPLNKWKD